MSQRAKIFAWFLAWAIPGLLLPGFFLLLPIGALIITPLVLLIAALLIHLHRPSGPEVLGVLLGVGLWGFAIAYFNRNSTCPQSGFGSPSSTSVTVTLRLGESSSSCFGVAPEPFLLVGALLVLFAILGAGIWMKILESSSEGREAAIRGSE